MGDHWEYAENFSCCREVIYLSVREKLYKKNTIWYIVFELKSIFH